MHVRSLLNILLSIQQQQSLKTLRKTAGNGGKETGQFSLRLTQDAFNGVALYELQIQEFDVCSS